MSFYGGLEYRLGVLSTAQEIDDSDHTIALRLCWYSVHPAASGVPGGNTEETEAAWKGTDHPTHVSLTQDMCHL